MKLRERPPPHRPPPTPASDAPAGFGTRTRLAQAQADADRVAEALLAEIRGHLTRVAGLASLEDAPDDTEWADAASHAPHGQALLPSSRRWADVAEAYRGAAASVARGDLVQAASRLRDARARESRIRRSLPWAADTSASDGDVRTHAPRIFASPRDIPPDIDALADAIAHRTGGASRRGVLDDLHRKPGPQPEPEPGDDVD